MARGRMISKSVSTSQKFASLVTIDRDLAEFCQTLYLLLIPHTDDFGRLQGDPFTVKSVCHPSSFRSLDEFGAGLDHLQRVELIAWYGVHGKQFIQVRNFENHQSGLHKRTKSRFPRVPGISGNVQEVPTQEKRTKEKRREENLREENKELNTDVPSLEEPRPIDRVVARMKAQKENRSHVRFR